MKKITIRHTYMRCAIQEAQKNFKSMKGGPFGACIVKKGDIISSAHNTVLISDATCHAEMNAIRIASKKLKTHDLSGCVIYSTAEPCLMCFSAIHWARIDAIVYGASIQDAWKAGFHEIKIPIKKIKKSGYCTMKIIRSIYKKACRTLLLKWQKLPHAKVY